MTQDSFYRTQRMRIIILITQDGVRVFIVDTFVKPDASDGPVGVRLVYSFHWYTFFFFTIQVLNRKCVWSRPKCGKDQKMRFATLLHTGSIVKGRIRIKFARETTAPEKAAFPQIRGITYYTLNPVILLRKNASWLFRKWLKRVAFCVCPSSVAVRFSPCALKHHFATNNQKIPQWTIIPNKNLGKFNSICFWQFLRITPSYFPVTNRSWPQTSLCKTGNLEAWGLTVLSSFVLIIQMQRPYLMMSPDLSRPPNTRDLGTKIRPFKRMRGDLDAFEMMWFHNLVISSLVLIKRTITRLHHLYTRWDRLTPSQNLSY